MGLVPESGRAEESMNRKETIIPFYFPLHTTSYVGSLCGVAKKKQTTVPLRIWHQHMEPIFLSRQHDGLDKEREITTAQDTEGSQPPTVLFLK